MPCNNCQKIIAWFEKGCQGGGEKAVKSLIKCKECSGEIVGRCHTCHWPIYRTELIYESSFNSSSRGNFWIWIIKSVFRIDDIQTVIQCEWCYNQWKVERKERRKYLKQKDLKLSVCFAFLFSPVLGFWYPEWIKRIFDKSKFFKNLSHPYLTIAILSIIIFFISLIMLSIILKDVPKADRYKLRKYRNKEDKEIKLKTSKKKPKV